MVALPPPSPPPTVWWFMLGLLAVQAGLLALWLLTFRQVRLLADVVLKQQQALAQLEPKSLCTFTVELGAAVHSVDQQQTRSN